MGAIEYVVNIAMLPAIFPGITATCNARN